MEGQPAVTDTVLLTVIGLFVGLFGTVGHLYTMVFDLRKQVREEMNERMTEIIRKMDNFTTMIQADRQLREETRVTTERELGRTVKHDDLQRATASIMDELREVKRISGSHSGFQRGNNQRN